MSVLLLLQALGADLRDKQQRPRRRGADVVMSRLSGMSARLTSMKGMQSIKALSGRYTGGGARGGRKQQATPECDVDPLNPL